MKLRPRFNTVYYLYKKERPYSDYADLLALKEKNGMKVTKCYKTDRAAASFVDVIGQSMGDFPRRFTLSKLLLSPYQWKHRCKYIRTRGYLCTFPF